MSFLCRWTLCGLAALAGFCFVRTAEAQAKGEGGPATLQVVLDRIHLHAGSEAWRENGFKDDVIEAWLDRAIGSIAKAAELPQLKLPVRLTEVKPADAGKGRALGKVLLVGKGMDLKSARLRNSIVLADGNVEFDQCEGCVIVARGVVVATQTSSSVIAAGAYVKIGTDGQITKPGTGSVIISRGRANIPRIHETILATGDTAIVESIPDGGIFVNSTLVMGTSMASSLRRRPRSIKVRDFPLEEALPHPLNKKVAVVGVVYPEVMGAESIFRRMAALATREAPPPGPTGLVFRLNDRRYAADVGKPIVDQAGQPVADLADWTLSYLDDEIAMFSTADADAVVSIQGR